MRYIVLAAALLLASPSWSWVWSGNCQFTGGNITGTVPTSGNSTNTKIGPGTTGCFRYTNGSDTAPFNTSTKLITVSASSAVIIFDPQLDAVVSVATAALVIPHVCPQQVVITAATPENSCISLGGAGTNTALDGVEGNAGSQNAAIRVGPGIYYFSVAAGADCLAGDTCQIAIKGEGE